MMSIHPSGTRACSRIGAALLVIMVAVEAALYPEIATWISGTIGNGATPDSSMGYFWDIYIIPSAVVFTGILIVMTLWSATKSHRTLHLVLGGLFLANVLGVVLSALWYFRVTAAAAGATTR